jgi:adenylate cyclase 10
LAISTPTGLLRVQEVMRAVQAAVYRFEGSINKFLMDGASAYHFVEIQSNLPASSRLQICDFFWSDKGSTLIAVFGLPPLAHEDDVRQYSYFRLKNTLHSILIRLRDILSSFN